MKKILLILVVLFGFTSCGNEDAEKASSSTFNTSNSELISQNSSLSSSEETSSSSIPNKVSNESIDLPKVSI